MSEIDAWLAKSFEDRRLSRSERQELTAFAGSLKEEAERDEVCRRAFELARSTVDSPENTAVLDWLEGVLRAVKEPASHAADVAEAHFSPGDDCPRAILRLLASARGTLDVCVFTITDDRLAEGLLDAHRRGVVVRVLTDNEKAEDLGSDVDRLASAGLAVRVDRSPFHMHHKFAVVDGRTLLSGSYNWTRGAARDNEENLLIVSDPRLVAPFARAFERLWTKLAPTP